MNRVGEKYFHYSFNSTKDGSYAYGLSFTHQSVSPQQQTIFRFPRAAKDSDIFYIAAEIGKEIDTHMTNFIRTGHSGRKWRREIADSKAETMVADMYSHNS